MSSDLPELPLIGVIAKLDLKPTDILVLKSRAPISDMTRLNIERHFRNHAYPVNAHKR